MSNDLLNKLFRVITFWHLPLEDTSFSSLFISFASDKIGNWFLILKDAVFFFRFKCRVPSMTFYREMESKTCNRHYRKTFERKLRWIIQKILFHIPHCLFFLLAHSSKENCRIHCSLVFCCYYSCVWEKCRCEIKALAFKMSYLVLVKMSAKMVWKNWFMPLFSWNFIRKFRKCF